MGVLRNRFHYAAEPRRVWALATDLNALAEVCAPYLSFDGLPKGRIRTGMTINVMVRLFGRLPAQPYVMQVELCDDDAMQFQSREKGAGVQRWDHRLWLTAIDGGTQMNEEILIEAGPMTPLFLLWARILYRGRHKPRLKLLQSGAF